LERQSHCIHEERKGKSEVGTVVFVFTCQDTICRVELVGNRLEYCPEVGSGFAKPLGSAMRQRLIIIFMRRIDQACNRQQKRSRNS
jgi:hypothetical protein